MVLRMLYIKDLRKLQTQIDEMIVQVQVSMMAHVTRFGIQAGTIVLHASPIICKRQAAILPDVMSVQNQSAGFPMGDRAG